QAYWDEQIKVDERWRDKAFWWRASALNTAGMGWFSSDRAIKEYAGEIWNAPFREVD
ncbi:MAG TPA: glycogen/starch/alpha-glucan phosphorylase, partial [Roseiarcus sp.]|nr:glycogen/starch/alpha-glucan phosphorylase [Roseiarcus sp.]